LFEVDLPALDVPLDVPNELLIRVGQRDYILLAVAKIAGSLLADGMERLNLPGFQFLVEDTVVEARRSFARLNDAFDHEEDRNHGKDDEQDRSEMFCHVAIKLSFEITLHIAQRLAL